MGYGRGVRGDRRGAMGKDRTKEKGDRQGGERCPPKSPVNGGTLLGRVGRESGAPPAFWDKKIIDITKSLPAGIRKAIFSAEEYKKIFT